MFEIEFSTMALDDLRWFGKKDQITICDEIEKQLLHQPLVETRNRKQLRPDHVTEWELRKGEIRIFYDVNEEESKVTIAAIGLKKRDKLFFRGQEFEHEDRSD